MIWKSHKLGVGVLSCAERTAQGRLWSDSNGENGTRHPVESLEVNFWRSVIIAELWRPEVPGPGNFVSNFCIFLNNDPLWWIFQNSVPKVFTASSIDLVVFKCRKICPTGNWRYHTLFITNAKNLTASQTVATERIAPKICQGQPPTFGSHCSRLHRNWFTFDGVIAERVKTVFCTIEHLHDRLFEPIIN